MTTILEVLEKGAHFLKQKGIEDARLNMELLVAHELGLQRMELYLRFDQPLEESQLVKLREMLTRRSQRIPLQHITAHSHFGHYRFKSDSRALVPRPETEELVALAQTLNFPKPARVLDLGCGTGVIGLTLAKELGANCRELILADLSTEALALTRENAADLEVEATVVHSDLFSKIEGTFDLIISNPPYIAESERDRLSPEVLHDPEMALFSGPDGLDLIRKFCTECSEFLNPGGWVALEVGYDQGEKVAKLLNEAGLQDVSVGEDLNGIARFPLARKS